MSHLKMKDVNDAINVVAETQIRHSLKEIDGDFAKIQLYSAKLFIELQREKRAIEAMGIKIQITEGKGMVRKIT